MEIIDRLSLISKKRCIRFSCSCIIVESTASTPMLFYCWPAQHLKNISHLCVCVGLCRFNLHWSLLFCGSTCLVCRSAGVVLICEQINMF